jgi:hypothetical protein
LLEPARRNVEEPIRRHLGAAVDHCLLAVDTLRGLSDLDDEQRVGASRMSRDIVPRYRSVHVPASDPNVLLEDLHWADPSSVDLLRLLSQGSLGQSGCGARDSTSWLVPDLAQAPSIVRRQPAERPLQRAGTR